MVSIKVEQNIFQSIDLPAGLSHVRYFYEPTHLQIPVLVAILAILAWIFAIVRTIYPLALKN
ncbi:MAG: hypothetical protein B7Z78_03790 [Rhodospirillales bacterium 20-60-12]|nr:MAG: hypothetical protein B7Z78_03790 [Rhodospirillales bacterium 20-60-12]